MKRLLLSISIILSVLTLNAQNSDTPIKAYVAANNDMPIEVADYLQTRLTNIITSMGVGVDDYTTSQFYTSAKLLVESKDVVGSAPTKYVYNISSTLYLADMVSNKIYSSITIPLKGAGDSETKAYINAFKGLNASQKKINDFYKGARKVIIDYYTSQGNTIIQKAKMLASQDKYDEALYLLTAIPVSCPDLYEKAQTEIMAVYNQYTLYNDTKILQQAKALWASTQNRDGAAEVALLLAEIQPDSPCQSQVDQLVKDIKGRIGDEWELTKRSYSDAVELEKQRIEAAKSIGVAFGNNQQPNTTNLVN